MNHAASRRLPVGQVNQRQEMQGNRMRKHEHLIYASILFLAVAATGFSQQHATGADAARRA